MEFIFFSVFVRVHRLPHCGCF